MGGEMEGDGMSDLKNCGCGDSPTSVPAFGATDHDWDIHCLGCGIFIVSETKEKAEQLWNDMQSARELREARPTYNPDYLCGKPKCEANTRGLLLEYSARIAELEAQVKAMRCCGNCENGIVGQLDLENKTCMECADDDLWQPRAASKEG
jgi:hypothetical protein